MHKQDLVSNTRFSVGIDFGTTKSALAYTGLRDPRPQPSMVSVAGAEFMPTAVFIAKDGQKRVGKPAEDAWRQTGEGKRFLRDFKLYLGDKRYSTFLRREFSLDGAYELAALVIYKLKSVAERSELRSGGRITEAVITYPAGWGNEEKVQLIKAANVAGIGNPILLKEPIAALYEVNRHRPLSSEGARIIVVLDYGGGTCDVAVCKTSPGSFLQAREPEVLAEQTEGFGGRDVDRAIVRWFIEEFHRQHPGVPEGCLLKYDVFLRQRAERHKEEFSNRIREHKVEQQCLGAEPGILYDFEIPRLYGNRTLKVEWDEQRFGEIIKPEVKRIVDPILKALEKAGLGRRDVQMVVLVGGSSLLPTVEERVRAMFSPFDVEVYVPPKPRHAVAYGAAILHYYERNPSERAPIEGRKRYSTLRIGLKENSTYVLVKAGAPIPVRRRVWECKTPDNNMRYVDILMLEGDEEHLEGNDVYAWKRFHFGKPVARGTRIVVEYEVDQQDILSMYAYLKEDPNINVSIVGRQSISPDDIERSRRRLALPDLSLPDTFSQG